MANGKPSTSKIRIDTISPEEFRAASEAGVEMRALKVRKAEIAERFGWKAQFFALVDVRGPNECWPWLGMGLRYGHGRFQTSKFEKSGSHQIAYLLSNGRIPANMCVCHSCDNGWCCNPAHLWLGTALENHEDCTAKGRRKGQRKPRGSQSSRSKLTETDVSRILSSNANYRELAKQFGVHPAHIIKIRSQRAWKHMPRAAS